MDRRKSSKLLLEGKHPREHIAVGSAKAKEILAMAVYGKVNVRVHEGLVEIKKGENDEWTFFDPIRMLNQLEDVEWFLVSHTDLVLRADFHRATEPSTSNSDYTLNYSRPFEREGESPKFSGGKHTFKGREGLRQAKIVLATHLALFIRELGAI